MARDDAKSASEIVAAMEFTLPPDPRLGDLVHALGKRAGSILLAAIAIPAIIPVPGVPLGAFFGTVLMIVACRMVVSGAELKLPRWLAQVRLGAPMVALLSRRGPALLGRIEHRLRPRASMMVAGSNKPILALVVALMGLQIALPIPFGNTLPGLSVILMGLGLAAEDGLAVLGALVLAILATAFSLALAWATWSGLAHLLG